MKAIIFDFGNVVGFFSHQRTYQRLAAHSPLSWEEMKGQIYGGDLEHAYESGRVSSTEALAEVRRRCALTCDDAILADAYCDIFWRNDAVCDLIPRLAGRYRLILGSNTTELHSQKFRAQFADTLRHFDHLVLSHEIGTRKPSPEFYDHCVKHARCAAQECVFVDDLPANVAGAVARGLHGIVYTGDDDLHRRLAHLGICA
jgi:putative hydrolase of the HAD superfamily